MKVYVVTISECSPVHESELGVEAFADENVAEQWIESQIAEKRKTYELSDDDIDGWYVEIEGSLHTIQYDIKKCELK